MAKFENHTLTSTVKFGSNQIRKIQFGSVVLLDTTGTKQAVGLNDFLTSWLLEPDITMPATCDVAVLSYIVNTDTLEVVIPEGDFVVRYALAEPIVNRLVESAFIEDMVPKAGISCQSYMSFPQMPNVTAAAGTTVSQESTSDFYIKFDNYPTMLAWLTTYTTNWKI